MFRGNAMHRQEAESGASARTRLAMLLSGCTDRALAAMTPEGLSATHRVKVRECDYALTIERNRRARRDG
jgi:hypothetical protein